jgi:glutathione S-transferase
MPAFTLSIGSKAYSSWSLRGWLMCKLAGIEFAEDFHHMGEADWFDWVKAKSPNAKVPLLRHHGAGNRADVPANDILVWESLAIAEYLNELRPEAQMWPEGRAARAQARAISNEMHAGFAPLRTHMWMTFLKKRPGQGRTPESLADVARIVDVWRETRAKFGATGPYLFGRRFTIADAMYAPVVVRFWAWGPELPAEAKDYCAAVWDHPFIAEWRAAAIKEKPVARYEALAD